MSDELFDIAKAWIDHLTKLLETERRQSSSERVELHKERDRLRDELAAAHQQIEILKVGAPPDGKGLVLDLGKQKISLRWDGADDDLLPQVGLPSTKLVPSFDEWMKDPNGGACVAPELRDWRYQIFVEDWAAGEEDEAEPTVDDLLAELFRRGWAGEYKSVEIHLTRSINDWAPRVRVDLQWDDEASSEWGHSTASFAYEEAPTLLEALTAIMPLAVADPPDEDAEPPTPTPLQPRIKPTVIPGMCVLVDGKPLDLNGAAGLVAYRSQSTKVAIFYVPGTDIPTYAFPPLTDEQRAAVIGYVELRPMMSHIWNGVIWNGPWDEGEPVKPRVTQTEPPSLAILVDGKRVDVPTQFFPAFGNESGFAVFVDESGEPFVGRPHWAPNPLAQLRLYPESREITNANITLAVK